MIKLSLLILFKKNPLKISDIDWSLKIQCMVNLAVMPPSFYIKLFYENVLVK